MTELNIFHPLTFRLQAGEKTLFSGEGEARIPHWISRSLNVKDGDIISVSLEELPKGEKVVLAPLGEQQPSDWSALLESQLRSFTTLTKGEVIEISCSTGPMKVLIKSLEPENAVTIIDTDLETDVEYMTSAAITKEDEVVNMQLDQSLRGKVDENQYRYFELESWNREKPLIWTLDIEKGDADILISTSSKPTIDNHVWSTYTGPIEINSTNNALTSATTLHMSIYGFRSSVFIVSVTQFSPQKDTHEGRIQCSNCKAWVPPNSMLLHSNFCSRNIIRCKCGDIIKSSEMPEHWHCDICNGHGMGPLSKEKHIWVFHISRTCTCFAEFASLPQLSQHKHTACPEKAITCRYCHLLVPQGDLSTLPQHTLLSSLTPHEVSCGSRTTNYLNVHTQLHVLQQRSMSKCRNSNCCRDPAENPYRLCAMCFGPLWSPILDTDGTKLRSRIERRLVLQLVRGCGRKNCRNSLCATAIGTSLPTKEANEMAKPIVENLGDETIDLPFCVDETTQKKMDVHKDAAI
ncbi:Ubiquitin fusion degradation protein 1 [Neolecta irregularis DAH-3]|uniref:Ubiquitin fusion degradation protein 1 n=1 Tax=Neolecta irregularis (strain DAH-3) TaxID=1198029 RepID=A0A1U7LM11_NEOID|nr:Ubiquitin fusion degradation protein 1 [Neolecta irregularis DAH-3]|eukprot:OLL23687.1 Ubiquitin fusion degradation protein 1 [Neolecta irregularis DAH-3]